MAEQLICTSKTAQAEFTCFTRYDPSEQPPEFELNIEQMLKNSQLNQETCQVIREKLKKLVHKRIRVALKLKGVLKGTETIASRHKQISNHVRCTLKVESLDQLSANAVVSTMRSLLESERSALAERQANFGLLSEELTVQQSFLEVEQSPPLSPTFNMKNYTDLLKKVKRLESEWLVELCDVLGNDQQVALCAKMSSFAVFGGNLEKLFDLEAELRNAKCQRKAKLKELEERSAEVHGALLSKMRMREAHLGALKGSIVDGTVDLSCSARIQADTCLLNNYETLCAMLAQGKFCVKRRMGHGPYSLRKLYITAKQDLELENLSMQVSDMQTEKEHLNELLKAAQKSLGRKVAPESSSTTTINAKSVEPEAQIQHTEASLQSELVEDDYKIRASLKRLREIKQRRAEEKDDMRKRTLNIQKEITRELENTQESVDNLCTRLDHLDKKKTYLEQTLDAAKVAREEESREITKSRRTVLSLKPRVHELREKLDDMQRRLSTVLGDCALLKLRLEETVHRNEIMGDRTTKRTENVEELEKLLIQREQQFQEKLKIPSELASEGRDAKDLQEILELLDKLGQEHQMPDWLRAEAEKVTTERVVEQGVLKKKIQLLIKGTQYDAVKLETQPQKMLEIDMPSSQAPKKTISAT